jgi:hypothetical protein
MAKQPQKSRRKPAKAHKPSPQTTQADQLYLPVSFKLVVWLTCAIIFLLLLLAALAALWPVEWRDDGTKSFSSDCLKLAGAGITGLIGLLGGKRLR